MRDEFTGKSIDYSYVEKAAAFAAERHRGQVRKQPPHPPYFSHLEEVVMILKEHGVTDTITLAAAYLHDILEDTKTSPDELEEVFGPQIAEIVEDVTTKSDIHPYFKKKIQIAAAPTHCERGKLIKIADKIANVRSMPDSWNYEKKECYVTEAIGVVNGCRGVHAKLEALFDKELALLGYDPQKLPNLKDVNALIAFQPYGFR